MISKVKCMAKILCLLADVDGQRRTIDSGDVNAYLRQITGQDFSTKDFRTWAGSVRALEALQACGACESLT
jgi:DNA topoisomerase I